MKQFADFFIEKIKNIREFIRLSEILLDYPLFQSEINSETAKMYNFFLVDETRVKNDNKLQTKACEFDYIPTHFLKEHLEEFPLTLTHIINLSLQCGFFATDRKVTILRLY